MTQNTKLFANNEQINPETSASQVKTGGTDVEAVLQQLISKVSALETRTPEPIRLSSRLTNVTYMFGGWDVVFENWKPEYSDFSKYRLCVMQKRVRNNGDKFNRVSGGKWRTAMLYELHPHPQDMNHEVANLDYCTIPAAPTVQLVSEQMTLGRPKSTNVIIRDNLHTMSPPLVFSATRRRESNVGVALYKFTGQGQFGWERVSNIAGIRSRIAGNLNVVLRRPIHEL